ncbi:PAS domain-containing protein [Polyangium aurulentum]|uniref:PAS domain-containing protein n=1 Tax=Polyangium aurulentum TaxID=2567896 RepID=UPI00197D3D24|nr:PAS domain-containing protein [Polyangium aurulentum]UQA54580.1 PAS domain-containing protein [Polyangium aurulentum]
MQKRIMDLEARLAEQERAAAARARQNGALSAEQDGQLRMLQAAVQSLSDGVIVCDAEGRLLHFNPAAEEIFGQGVTGAGPEEWSNEYGLFQVDGITPLPASEIPLVRALRGELAKGIELIARSEKRPEGIHVDCSARPIYDEAGELRGAVVVCRDISDRVRFRGEREQRLQAEAQRSAAEKEKLHMGRLLRVLLDHLDIIVWAIDEKGVYTFHDGRGIDKAGLGRGQYIGKNTFELYGEALSVNTRRALAGTVGHDLSEVHEMTWENWHIPVHDEDGTVSGVMGMSLDVTDAHRVKAELEARLALIERQQEVIRNLETPVIQVWDHVVTLPMVGVVDSRRAARVMDDLLAAISRTQARFAILDLTGVDVVDTSTASHMLGIISAVRLLGAEGIITGIRPNVAQTVVSLGLDLSRVTTLATLRDGLAFAMRKLGAGGERAKAPRAER